jgi:hypothetical protein
LFEDKCTKDDKTTVLLQKKFFSLRKLPQEFCYAKKLQVKHLIKEIIIEATLLTEYAKEKLYLFPEYQQMPSDYPFLFTGSQFLVKLCFANQ